MTGIAELLFLDLDGQPPGRGKRVARAVLAFGLAIVPLLICVDQRRKAAALRRRPIAACTVLESGVDRTGSGAERENPYRAWVRFALTFNGRSHVVRWVDDAGEDASEAYAAADRYPAGTRASCYVDTSDPAASVPVQPVPNWEAFVVPGCALVAVAVVVLYCWPQLRLAWSPPDPTAVGGVRVSRWAALFWGAMLFAGAGSVVVGWWGIPIVRTVLAFRWPAVPCVVEASGIQVSEVGGETPITVCRTDVLYRYTLGGRTYHSNRYSLTESGSPARGGRSRVAGTYPVGHRATCYVDPADPASAVLARHVSPTVAFATFPLAMAALGFVLLVSGGDDRRASACMRGSRVSLMVLGAIALLGASWGVFGRP